MLLVHSPLVGPTTWRWVAAALAEAGHDAVVPDLRSSAMTGRPQAFVDEVMHSHLETENGLTLMAADTPNSMDLTNYAVSLSGDDEAELAGR